MVHTVKGFGIVNKAEVDVFLELSCFFDDPTDVGNLISGSSAFQNPAWTSGSSRFTYCWSLAWRILSITWHMRWVQLCGSLCYHIFVLFEVILCLKELPGLMFKYCQVFLSAGRLQCVLWRRCLFDFCSVVTCRATGREFTVHGPKVYIR